MPKVKVDDIQIYYEETGSGDAIVFITGLAGSHWDWHPQVPFFSERFRTVVLDNRGVGQTDKPKEGYSVSRFADDIVGLMDHLGIEKAHIVGLSLGGMIAQEVALSYPWRVIKLILCVTHSGRIHSVQPSDGVKDILLNNQGLTHEEILRRSLQILFTPKFIKNSPHVVEDYIQRKLNYSKQTFNSFNGQFQAAMAFNSFDRLSQIELPTLVVSAEGDVLVPPENSGILAGKIPGSELTVFDDGGHMLNIELEEKFNNRVLEFVKD